MRVDTARHAADLLAPLFAGAADEGVAAMHADGAGRLLAIDEFGGGVEEIALPIRAILRRALNLGARGLVIAHNHPSGDPAPSPADVAATRRLATVCETLGVTLHDHLIFARAGCESFRRLGLL